MRKSILLLLFVLSFHAANAQEHQLPISISIFNNGTMMPGAGYLGVFSKNIHPGINLGTSHLYGSGKHHELFQTFKLGYFYHHFSQHAVQLYSELGYRYFTNSGVFVQGLLGVGYLHSFADVQQFTLKNGEYRKKANWGRPQFMGSVALGLGYNLNKISQLPLDVFLQYQFWVQAPFVNKYVPILPNNAFHIGVLYSLKYGKKLP